MWDKRFGGMEDDIISCINKTSDGGYILGGWSFSGIGGDKTEDTHDTGASIFYRSDFWLVKLDSVGNKNWDKDFGGSNNDAMMSLQQTRDGGYILGGNSYSAISGDKSQACWAGTEDYWILKLDSLGNKLWDKDFGGTSQEQFSTVIQTDDGGYLIGGESASGISGDKTEDTIGNWDYWIVKLDSLGNKQWDKDFGGTGRDYLFSFQQTSDHGFILGGWSESDIGGDKTQPIVGDKDYWIIKLDSLANKEWDRNFGGTEEDILCSIKQTKDNGYILSGISSSDISGDKSELSWGLSDYWIVKLDSMGNQQWDKDLGGINRELLFFRNIQETSDSGFIIGGSSESDISGDKTENNLGYRQTWVIRIDSLGNKLWDKTIFTTAFDMMCSGVEIDNQCFTIVNTSWAGIGGYKTQPAWNSVDYWVIKFCESNIPNVAFFTLHNSFCPGTCTDFLNLSINAITYQWSFPGASPDTSTATSPTNICYTTPGNYDVQLIATNANGSDTLLLTNYITVYPIPQAQSITQTGDTLFANQGSATYQWYFNTNIISAATNYFYVATQSGNYSVVATDSNGCEVEAVIDNVIANTNKMGVGNWQLAINPNPVTTTLNIRGLENNSADEIKIFNVFGEEVFSAVNWKLSTVNCDLFPPGLYYLEIIYDIKFFRTKFLKQ
jgi:hypothetical protein